MYATLIYTNLLLTKSPKLYANKIGSGKNRLGNFCVLPVSQKKILDIALGILRKNKKVTKQVASLDLQIRKLTTQINHLYRQLVTLKKVLPKEKANIFLQSSSK